MFIPILSYQPTYACIYLYDYIYMYQHLLNYIALYINAGTKLSQKTKLLTL